MQQLSLLIIIFLIILCPLVIFSFNDKLRTTEKIFFLILIGFLISLIFEKSILQLLMYKLGIKEINELFIFIYMPISLWWIVRSHMRINKLSVRINKLVSETAKIVRKDRESD